MEFREGTEIDGRYRLEEPIGRGGMATIWRARHLELASPVAVKILHGANVDPAFGRRRFLREAQSAASVRHRNVVDVIDFGEQDGTPYMVMELLEGQSLAERLCHGPPLTLPDLVRITSDALGGLAAVHDAGIVHRDLKPENIVLVEDGDGVYPKIVDFGISRLEPGARTEQAKPTMESVLVGTPEYMAPEQARGLRDIDKRADIYSLATILYEALTGRPPHSSPNVGDLIVLITTTDPPTLAEQRSELGDALSQVLERAMKRDREERFQSAREFRAALLEAANASSALLGDWRGAVSVVPSMPVDRDAETLGPESLSSVSYGDTELGRLAPAPTVSPDSLSSVVTTLPVLPTSRSGRWASAALVGSAMVGFVVLAGVWMTEPSMPRTLYSGMKATAEVPDVSIALDGVPPGAHVQIDGRATNENPLRVANDGEMHRIEVTLDGYLPWSVTHRATSNATLGVTLHPLPEPSGNPAPSADEPAATALPPASRRFRRPVVRSRLIRNPDF